MHSDATALMVGVPSAAESAAEPGKMHHLSLLAEHLAAPVALFCCSSADIRHRAIKDGVTAHGWDRHYSTDSHSAEVTHLLLSTRADLLDRCQRFVNGLIFGNAANP